MNLKHTLLMALLIGLLAACGSDAPDAQAPTAQLSETQTNAAFGDLSSELVRTVFSMNGDTSSVALRQFPKDAANFPLTQQETQQALPRGLYIYDAEQNAWQRRGDDDALVLTWPYSDLSANEVTATLTFDWAAGAQTITVAGPAGESFEAPTSLDVTVVAGEQEVADVNLALSYYSSAECGTIAEPTRLNVNGTGSLFDLNNVGYSVTEEDGADSVTTQGEVTSKEGPVLGWNVTVNGERERESCFTSDYKPASGSVNVSLASEAGSFAFATDIDNIEDESVGLSNGTVQIDGATALSFEGTLDDQNGNGVPGENVDLSFAGGNTTTLEQALQKSRAFVILMRGMRAGH